MNHILEYYNQFDEWGRLDRAPLEFIVHWHFISSLSVTITDLTPRLVQIARDKAKDLMLEKHFNGFYVADARNLSLFGDEAFTASLMMGPLYHLQERTDREKSVSELYRVTQKGGYVFVAFMTRVRHLQNALAYPEHWKPTDRMDEIRKYMETGVFNHSDEGRFTGAYAFTINEIKPFMEANGFESIKLIGSTSAAGALTSEQLRYWETAGEHEYRAFLQLLFDYAADEHLLGSSSHLLYIGRRK
ncbi:ubiquinone/menaquinone biosynthesis C-methylase UbiE [Paenibacillus endophyticus]|uniref:Ubiquinone/menaquinone biosynthesis C-methylase UbiE n=1 Tax=Paenibacillus endophyticus TaxID=1294268 RepID=A0A7W5C760_9BACL|nr:class I SAM-dependent methyltransferase [Paenibacillus endophyticus]MBB3152418.1 ubiquinone/menaquinone biosynthesis C-methylase UbiE [Paenibacillus endophyticus]